MAINTAEIVEIGGLWRTRFYTTLNDMAEPIRDRLLDLIEYCKKEEVKGGEFAKDARNSLNAYLEILQLLFPDTYAEVMGDA